MLGSLDQQQQAAAQQAARSNDQIMREAMDARKQLRAKLNAAKEAQEAEARKAALQTAYDQYHTVSDSEHALPAVLRSPHRSGSQLKGSENSFKSWLALFILPLFVMFSTHVSLASLGMLSMSMPMLLGVAVLAAGFLYMTHNWLRASYAKKNHNGDLTSIAEEFYGSIQKTYKTAMVLPLVGALFLLNPLGIGHALSFLLLGAYTMFQALKEDGATPEAKKNAFIFSSALILLSIAFLAPFSAGLPLAAMLGIQIGMGLVAAFSLFKAYKKKIKQPFPIYNSHDKWYIKLLKALFKVVLPIALLAGSVLIPWAAIPSMAYIAVSLVIGLAPILLTKLNKMGSTDQKGVMASLMKKVGLKKTAEKAAKTVASLVSPAGNLEKGLLSNKRTFLKNNVSGKDYHDDLGHRNRFGGFAEITQDDENALIDIALKDFASNHDDADPIAKRFFSMTTSPNQPYSDRVNARLTKGSVFISNATDAGDSQTYFDLEKLSLLLNRINENLRLSEKEKYALKRALMTPLLDALQNYKTEDTDKEQQFLHLMNTKIPALMEKMFPKHINEAFIEKNFIQSVRKNPYDAFESDVQASFKKLSENQDAFHAYKEWYKVSNDDKAKEIFNEKNKKTFDTYLFDPLETHFKKIANNPLDQDSREEENAKKYFEKQLTFVFAKMNKIYTADLYQSLNKLDIEIKIAQKEADTKRDEADLALGRIERARELAVISLSGLALGQYGQAGFFLLAGILSNFFNNFSWLAQSISKFLQATHLPLLSGISSTMIILYLFKALLDTLNGGKNNKADNSEGRNAYNILLLTYGSAPVKNLFIGLSQHGLAALAANPVGLFLFVVMIASACCFHAENQEAKERHAGTEDEVLKGDSKRDDVLNGRFSAEPPANPAPGSAPILAPPSAPLRADALGPALGALGPQPPAHPAPPPPPVLQADSNGAFDLSS